MKNEISHESTVIPMFPIDGNSVYMINPLFRFRNETDHILIYGMQGIGSWHVHRSFGVLLSLFNGERTVSEIVDIVLPLVEGINILGKDQKTIAYEYVSSFIALMTKSKTQQMGKDNISSQFPSEAVLLSQKDYGEKFRSIHIFNIQYDPYVFLPNSKLKVSSGPFRVIHNSAPHSLNWHLTSSCSTNCKYCYLKRRILSLTPIERLCQLIDEAAHIGVFEINLLGGDVLLYPHLIKVMKQLHNYKFLPMVLSSKSFLSEELALSLSELRELIYEMQFSIDSDDSAISEYLVGVPNFPNTIFSSIENALHAGLNVTAKSVITPYNLKTVPRLYRKLKERGVNKIRLAVYSRSGYHHSDDLFLSQNDFDWINNEIDKLNTEFTDDNIMLQNGQPGFEKTSPESLKSSWPNRSVCTAGRVNMMICADGIVIPCEQMPETEKYFCGDLNHQSIMDVWNSERLKEMTYGMPQEYFKNTPCYDCAERDECHNIMGFCIRDLAVHHGDIYQPPANCYKNLLNFIRMS